MIGYKENIFKIVEKESHLCVVLIYHANYVVRGSRATELQLEYEDMLHLSNVLYVSSMKKNRVFVSSLEDKGYKVAF